MKICHFSDWHRNFRRLPEADLYVCTGDMLPNFPLLRIQPDKWRREIVYWDPYSGTPQPSGYYMGRWIEREREENLQRQWMMQQNFRREFLPDPDAPIVCVRGNHDFVAIADLFGGDVWEVDDDPTRTTTIGGLKIGGHRGVNWIGGEWQDEMRTEQMDDLAQKLPEDLDILITHAPPYGVLDFYGDYLGSRGLRRYINKRGYSPKDLKAHCFGHIHEGAGQKKLGDVIFSNGSLGYNLFEL